MAGLVFLFSNYEKKRSRHCYFNEYFLQKQPFLVLRLVWVAGWLWRLHKQCRQCQRFFGMLLLK
jgi:hypothetical protein